MTPQSTSSGPDEPARTLILSDLHLGRRRHAARSADDFRPLWRGFDRVIFNGDLAEFHHPRRRTNAAREVMRLLDLCQQDHVEAVVLSGNHDPFISERRRLYLASGEVFITHGDVFHPAIAPWSPAAPKMEEENERAFQSLRGESSSKLEARLQASQHASHVEWTELEKQARRSSLRGMLLRPWSIAQVLWYWQRFPGIVARFAAEHDIDARFIVCGHTHHPGIWERGGRMIINTGSYGFPGHPLGVTLAGEKLGVWRIERGADGYRLSPEPMRSFALAVADAAPQRDTSALKTRDGKGRPSAAAM